VRPALKPVGPGFSPLERRYGFDRLFDLTVGAEGDIPALAEALSAHPSVDYAEPDFIGSGGQTKVVPDDTSFAEQWNLDNTGQTGGTADADMDAAEAWRIAIGRRETVVAVLDTGIDGDHPEFLGRVARGGRDTWNEDIDPEADHSHGAHVSGIIGANSNNGFSVTGVNWRSAHLPVKVLDANNSGTTLNLLQGIRHAALRGADVSNMSLINFSNTAGLADAVRFAHDAGVIQIGCNGNSGSSAPNYPSAYPEVIATGWTNDDDLRSGSSNHTTTLDIVAPGVLVPTVRYNTSSDGFTLFSGCSAATPNAAGVAAVLLAIDPTLTFDQVKSILESTADDEVGDPSEDVPGRDDYYGWGRVNMEAALAAVGLVSRDRVHVDDIVLEKISNVRLAIQVAVVDDLTGAEEGVLVEGSLITPEAQSVPLSGTTEVNGFVTITYQPGGPLPAGAFSFAVDNLTKSGFSYDPSRNHVSEVSHDPDLDGVHVNAIDMTDDLTSLTIEVQVLDDDLRPEGDVTVNGTLTTPGGFENFSGTAVWASAGVVQFIHTPALLDPGAYSFEVTSLSKTGFTYESARNVETIDNHTVDDPTGDVDGDGVGNATDNCRYVSNDLQTDTDGDGPGDACDTCRGLIDPAQEDIDGDGTGDRCDCAPFDPATADVGEVTGLRFDADTVTVRWDGVVGADFYDVSRGLISSLDGADYGACLSENLTGTTLQDVDLPADGEGFFYLVRADDAVCGPGPAGLRGDDQPRSNTNPLACLP
jgi:hypothetical protein